jgi:hypothetical protein
MTDQERWTLMQQKAALKAELLELTKNISRVRVILREIDRIDKQLET